MVFSFLDPVLGPLLTLPDFWAIVLLSFLVSLMITLVYKYTTNQSVMKQLKGEIKELQKEMKALKNDPDQAMQVQKRAMKTNFKYMSMSLRSTFITLIPILFIFGWMNAHYSFDPITPDQQFTTTLAFGQPIDGTVQLIAPQGIGIDGRATKEVSGESVFWTLTGSAGQHTLEYVYDGRSYFKDVLITTENRYLDPVQKVNEQGVALKTIAIDHQKKIVMNLLGLKVGWIISYILFSILFSIGMRKLLRVY